MYSISFKSNGDKTLFYHWGIIEALLFNWKTNHLHVLEDGNKVSQKICQGVDIQYVFVLLM